MTQEHVESQLSAMFDGELPAAECELLSRRIDRDEHLRARWARYALIGAAMRSEPVATAGRGFARRVSAAIDSAPQDRIAQDRITPDRINPAAESLRQGAGPSQARSVRTLRSSVLAASIVAAVAGVSIGMLRYSTPTTRGLASNKAALAPSLAPAVARAMNDVTLTTPVALAASADRSGTMPGTTTPIALRAVTHMSSGEPRSYVTPLNVGNGSSSGFGLRTQLADFIVAHSEYSTPLMRRSLLSALVSSEEAAEAPAPHISAAALADQTDAAHAASVAGR